MTFKWPKPFTEMTFEEKMRHVDKVAIEDPLVEKVEAKLAGPITEEEIRIEVKKLEVERAMMKAKAEGKARMAQTHAPRTAEVVDERAEAKRRALGRW